MCQKISVIIPVYNEDISFRDRLGELLSDSSSQIEFIVVDASEFLGNYSRFDDRVRVVQSDRGRGIQLNEGARQAAGELLLFLHADTILPIDWSESIVASFGDTGVSALSFSLKIDHPFWGFRFIEFGVRLRSRFLGLPYGDQGLCIRRTVFDELGGFPTIPIMEDVALIRRLKKHGYRVCILRESVVTSARRWVSEGIVFTTIRNWGLLLAFQVGVSPMRLAKWYRPQSEITKV